MWPGKVLSSLRLRQTPDARSSPPAHPLAPAARRSIHQRPPRQRRQSLASRLAGSRSNHADEPVDVALRVIQMWRDANVAFAQAYANIFLSHMLIMLRCFLSPSRRKASIRTAPRGIQWTRDDKAIFGQTFKQESN